MDTLLRDLRDHPHLRVDDFIVAPDAVTILAQSTAPAADCSSCARPSTRVHGRYLRRVRDLSWLGRPVHLRVTARKFLCRNPACPRAVFCERLPPVVAPSGRTTTRLSDVQRAFGLALGGEAGARLARRAGMPVSPDTLLRRVKHAPPGPAAAGRVIGIDDWAWRKGQRYGTILVDLEQRRVVDLLPDREAATVARWLQGQPQIEVISRDRSGSYAQAASQGAPQAQQVADRWHLLKNLREAAQRLFKRRASVVHAILPAPPCPVDTSPPPDAAAPARPVCPNSSAPGSARQQAQKAKREQRVERHRAVRRQHRQGKGIREIARELGLSRGAVRRYLRSDRCPDWQRREPSRTQLDSFRGDIDERIRAGCHNAAALHRELAQRGCRTSYDSVRRFVARRLAVAGLRRQRVHAAQAAAGRGPSARTLSHEVVGKPEDRKADAQARVERLRGAGAEVGGAVQLVEELAAMIRKRSPRTLADWLREAEEAASPEVRGFARGVRQDEEAVAAALQQPWSNGQVEGQVNRLKGIKRQMYGRAGFELLRARVLDASRCCPHTRSPPKVRENR
jgi:transposase